MMLDKLLGLAIGGGIFLIITLIGGLIAGKEAMGFGDVKLMGASGNNIWCIQHCNNINTFIFTSSNY